MDACCEQKADEITTLRGKHKNVLVIVLIINAVLFMVEAAAGLLAHSTALLRLSGHAGRLAGLWIQPLRPLAQRGMDTLKDPEFLAEAKKGWLDIEPADGAELEQNVREIFKLEPALTAKLKEILK